MKCAWFCSCAHLQDFSFFVYSLIDCVTGEFLGDVDRKLATPPARSAVPWKRHCGTLSLHLDRRAELGCSSLLKVMLSSFSLLFVVLLLSLMWGSWKLCEKLIAWSTCDWAGWPRSEAQVSCSLYQHLSCTAGWSFSPELPWAELWNNPFLGEITWFHTNVLVRPWYSSHAARSLVPLQFSWVTSAVPVLCPEGGDLCALFCLLAWPCGFHTGCLGGWSISFCSGHCSVTCWGFV